MALRRAVAVLTVLVVAPLWLARGDVPWGDDRRLAMVSSLERPLRFLQTVASNVTSVVRAPALRAENARLRQGLFEQRHESVRAEELAREVDRLRRLLRLRQERGQPAVAARIIGRDATPWFRTLLIDQGREAGLVEGSAVVVEPGLVGQVFEVGSSVARLLLVTDPRFRVGALVQRSRAQGLVVGTVQGRCYLAYLTSSDASQVGDIVLTAGGGPSMPKGLVIGRVVRIERDPSRLYWQAQLAPAVDPAVLEEVLCLP